MKQKKLILFGTGDIAQIAHDYFEKDSEYSVVAFTVDQEFLTGSEFEKKPLFPFENIETIYTPAEYEIFIALSYTQLNKLREKKYLEAKEKGYKIASFISSKCTYLSKYPPGENAFIFEDNTIQPYVKIGDNVTLWSGNHIGHHSIIKDHNFISSHVVISGHCIINSHCFLGVNSTLAHKVEIGERTIVGAGAVITKNTEQDSIYVAPRSVKLDKKSNEITL